MWQECAVAACVVAAFCYLARNALRPRRAGCGTGCGGCGNKPACQPHTPQNPV